MRGKEDAHDYRYFPDPDLLPLVIDPTWIDAVKERLPELPRDKKERFIEALGLTAYDAEILTSDRDLADYFETCLKTFSKPKPVSNWIITTLLGMLKTSGKRIDASPVSAHHLAGLLKMVDTGVISGKIAKTVFEEMARTGKPSKAIIEEKGLTQVTDLSAIEAVVETVVGAHPDQAEQYRGGKTKLLGFFVGQVMKETRGKANPKIVNEVLKKRLAG